MATSANRHVVETAVEPSQGVDLPDTREYDSEPAARLDRELVDAIEAARDADNDSLATLLTFELGSHYWSR